MTIATRERIRNEALTLFAIHGYEGVSVRDIAKAVDIKESSLYKHYRNKQAIFDSLLEEMSERYRSMEGSLGISADMWEGTVSQYSVMTEETLVELSQALFLYYLRDEYAAKFRRMLTIEQYRNNRAGAAFADSFLDAPLLFQGTLFDQLVRSGAFMDDADPAIMALHFYSPLFLLLCRYDNQPAKEAEALERVKRHVVQFRKLYTGRRR